MVSVSKNGYIDKLDDIVNKYNNTHYRTIKMKPVDVKSNTYIDSSKEINDKDPKFKKIFLKKVTLQIDQKKFLWLNKLKIPIFLKNNCKKQIKNSLELKK